jgi:hypothetical protein
LGMLTRLERMGGGAKGRAMSAAAAGCTMSGWLTGVQVRLCCAACWGSWGWGPCGALFAWLQAKLWGSWGARGLSDAGTNWGAPGGSWWRLVALCCTLQVSCGAGLGPKLVLGSLWARDLPGATGRRGARLA